MKTLEMMISDFLYRKKIEKLNNKNVELSIGKVFKTRVKVEEVLPHRKIPIIGRNKKFDEFLDADEALLKVRDSGLTPYEVVWHAKPTKPNGELCEFVMSFIAFRKEMYNEDDPGNYYFKKSEVDSYQSRIVRFEKINFVAHLGHRFVIGSDIEGYPDYATKIEIL